MTSSVNAIKALLPLLSFPLGSDNKHPLLTADGSEIYDPQIHGFEEEWGASHCRSYVLIAHDYLVKVTDHQGCDFPDPEDWEGNLIGVYHNNDELTEVGILTAKEWSSMLLDTQAL